MCVQLLKCGNVYVICILTLKIPSHNNIVNDKIWTSDIIWKLYRKMFPPKNKKKNVKQFLFFSKWQSDFDI